MRRRSRPSQAAWAAATALFVGISVSTTQPTAAAPNSDADQNVGMTSSLSSGYLAEGPKSNPVTEQVT